MKVLLSQLKVMILEVRRSSDQELAESHVFEAGSWMLEAEICQLEVV